MIVVSEFIAPSGADLLAASGRKVISEPTLWCEYERFQQALAEAEALIVRNQTQVTEQLLEQAPHLRVVGRLGVGLDNIDLAAARQRGIVVTAGRNANAIAVAEYVMAALLHDARDIAAADASVRGGAWDRQHFGGFELWGHTLGLVGVGEIGRRVAKRAHAFGMRIIGYDPLVGPYDFAPGEQEITLLPLEEVLTRADAISLHVPLIPATHHLINAERLHLLRPNAILINSARGGIIDETALLEALNEGCLRRAVLDVREAEPPPADDPLRSCASVLLTPHVAGLTAEAQERTAYLVVTDVLQVLAGGTAIGAV